MNSSNPRLLSKLQNADDWKMLLNGKVDVILLKNFANQTECIELASFTKSHPRLETYSTAYGLSRLGNSFTDIRKTSSISDEYDFPDILQDVIGLNEVIPRVVGRIAASWPYGIETLSYKGKALHRTISRLVTDGGAEPHDDDISKELSEDEVAITVIKQLGVNLYVETPEDGGELEGWHLRLDKQRYDALRNKDPKLSYGLNRDLIHSPDWVIKPSIGDLIIFQNSEIHAIRKAKGSRITWGFFLGYRSDNKPLLIWS